MRDLRYHYLWREQEIDVAIAGTKLPDPLASAMARRVCGRIGAAPPAVNAQAVGRARRLPRPPFKTAASRARGSSA